MKGNNQLSDELSKIYETEGIGNPAQQLINSASK